MMSLHDCFTAKADLSSISKDDVEQDDRTPPCYEGDSALGERSVRRDPRRRRRRRRRCSVVPVQ